MDSITGRKKEGELYFKEFKNKDEKYSLDIPQNWRVVDIKEEYGYIFSDQHSQEGVLTIRSISSLFYNLQKFSKDLIAGMKKNNGYRVISTRNIKVGDMEAIETIFKASALVNDIETGAAIINTIIHHEPQARFYILSYSVLEKDMNKYAIIYARARDSFRVL